MFLKNTWYVACTPDEIDGKPLGRQICGERMVLSTEIARLGAQPAYRIYRCVACDRIDWVAHEV